MMPLVELLTFPTCSLDNTPTVTGTIAHVTNSVPPLAAGSAGTVETRYLDLPEPVRLYCGRELHPVRVAYETYGVLSP